MRKCCSPSGYAVIGTRWHSPFLSNVTSCGPSAVSPCSRLLYCAPFPRLETSLWSWDQFNFAAVPVVSPGDRAPRLNYATLCNLLCWSRKTPCCTVLSGFFTQWDLWISEQVIARQGDASSRKSRCCCYVSADGMPLVRSKCLVNLVSKSYKSDFGLVDLHRWYRYFLVSVQGKKKKNTLSPPVLILSNSVSQFRGKTFSISER